MVYFLNIHIQLNLFSLLHLVRKESRYLKECLQTIRKIRVSFFMSDKAKLIKKNTYLCENHFFLKAYIFIFIRSLEVWEEESQIGFQQGEIILENYLWNQIMTRSIKLAQIVCIFSISTGKQLKKKRKECCKWLLFTKNQIKMGPEILRYNLDGFQFVFSKGMS